MKFIKYLLLSLLSTSALAETPFAIINVVNATYCYVNGNDHRIGMSTPIEAVSGPNNELSVIDVGKQGKVAIFEDTTQLYAILDYDDDVDRFHVKYTPGKKNYIVTLENTNCGVSMFQNCVTFSFNNPCAI